MPSFDVVSQVDMQEIDNAVIYYADAWAIAFELADSDWSDMAGEFGEITLFYTGRKQPDAITLTESSLPPTIDEFSEPLILLFGEPSSR